ncbi:hypothetical protein P152DRAFT_7313 [Eremomyces bilateralis CBS 781.70]|uniref:GPI anchored protein n=1 Tax=Eremomyces bilateralis CBS 781.70 TaxID=1392243 RepID=A0A6G1GG74_9PEZI|nr:uncharacterized protein P152DRAFT_7313 [Eremomyces bilateralis CBS 781.70]KAF1817068.1 hypothetical protein P152DRAFT_7313 [Eremomyces bilateralis CBS 781.70]
MQFKNIALLSLAAGAMANPEVKKRQDATSSLDSSILSVLVTALPASLLAVAATDTAAVSSIIASEFAAGSTPSWFAALPTDVQTYLLGPDAEASSSIATGPIPSISGDGVLSIQTTKVPPTTGDGSGASNGTTSRTSRPSSRSTPVPTTAPESTGGAAIPTGVVGVGAAAALGLLGVLAL